MFLLRFRLLLSGLLLASIGLVSSSDSERYDILKGTQKQSACTLQGNIVENCPTPSTRRDFSPSSILVRDSNDTAPVPSKCTCTLIFFNIWSACCYSTGNITLPDYTQWMQSCKTNSIGMDSSTTLGINVPMWAKLPVPGNTTFDLQRAVTLVNSSSARWTTFQIVLPVVAAVATLVLSVVVPRVVHRRKSLRGDSHEGSWPKGLKRLRLRHHEVITIDRDNTWQIDGPESAFVNYEPSAEKNISHGQPLPHLDLESSDVHESDKNPKSIPSSNSKPSTGPHSFRISTRSAVRLPWKRRPPQIRLVPATSRFRVDDVNRSIYTCSSKANTEEGANRFSQMDEAPEPGDDDYVLPDDDETTDLITPSERAERDSQDVILISKGGRRDFTVESRSTNTVSINSHIKIESPSVSSASPHSSMQPVSAKPTLHIPIPPPPPSHAAPTPPIMPRSLRHPEQPNKARPLPYFPPSVLPPITEASTPARSFSSFNVSIHRSRAVRRPSNPESLSSLYTSPDSLELATSTQSRSIYSNLRRTASEDSDFSRPFGSEHDHIYMEVSTNGEHQEPAIDDTSSLSRYFTSPVQDEPRQMHPVRIRPPLDAATLFPGAVHGAGYPRTYFRPGDPF